MISASTSGSMLPPHSTSPTLRPAKRARCFSSAARPAAPAPSTTVFSISSSIRIACSMSSSSTSSTSSTRSRISGSVSAPGVLDARCRRRSSPAALARRLAVHRVPCRREALGLHADHLDVGLAAPSPRSRCRRSGRRRRSATTSVSSSGCCASISSADRALAGDDRGSSYGWTSVRPRSRASSSAVRARVVEACRRRAPPRRRSRACARP